MLTWNEQHTGLRIGRIYKHYKRGGLYKLLALAHLESDLELMAVYVSFEGGSTWVRPAKEFIEVLEGKPRFELMDFSKEAPCTHERQTVNDRSQAVCLDCNEELGR